MTLEEILGKLGGVDLEELRKHKVPLDYWKREEKNAEKKKKERTREEGEITISLKKYKRLFNCWSW